MSGQRGAPGRLLRRLADILWRIRVRLLVINVVAVMVPVVGIGWARTYEREGLRALEDDLVHQSSYRCSRNGRKLGFGEKLLPIESWAEMAAMHHVPATGGELSTCPQGLAGWKGPLRPVDMWVTRLDEHPTIKTHPNFFRQSQSELWCTRCSCCAPCSRASWTRATGRASS